MITKNFTSQPTFFGCNDTSNGPLVLYLPNSPWTAYSNYSYQMSSFTDEQLNATIDNAFQLATYGNGSFDAEWSACLACAAITRSAERVCLDLPEQCTRCFSRHCWDGKESDAKVSEKDLDLKPKLNTTLTFQAWNSTVWQEGSGSSQGGGGGGSGGSGGSGGGGGNGGSGGNGDGGGGGSGGGSGNGGDGGGDSGSSGSSDNGGGTGSALSAHAIPSGPILCLPVLAFGFAVWG